MSKTLQPVRGTHDLLPDDMRRYNHIVRLASDAARCYGFEQMSTPVFEFSEVFHRTLGDTSDVVSKETYTFDDRGGESITLRPEMTASMVRAFLSNGLQETLPCKFFYAGPAFRYERPQKGRQRQFHQIGVELLGAGEVQADIEVIALAQQLFGVLGLADKVTLEINSLGDSESRTAYRAALVEYFTQHKDTLSEDSRKRLEKNPLRILDSKDAQDQILASEAPDRLDYFNDGSKAFFDSLRERLDVLGIRYKVNPNLVRGLDYYAHTVFEFTTEALGAQNAVLAGGRYDGLVELMGGPPTPGIGWAAGIERMMALLEAGDITLPEKTRPIVMIPLGEAAEQEILNIACALRRQGFVIEQGYRGNMTKRMKKADKLGACAALILGEDELKANMVLVKDLSTGKQQTVPREALEQALAPYKQDH